MDYRKLIKGLHAIENWLVGYQEKELLDSKNLDIYRYQLDGLENNIRLSMEKGRKLVIGVIGDVKAGKSSLLNALLFDGEDFLPKAATPMTASLTKLSYGDTPRATVFFFNREDWAAIEKKSRQYDVRLEADYKNYCDRQMEIAKKKDNVLTKDIKDIGKPPMVSLPSMEEYEKNVFRRNCTDEFMKSAKEFTQMVKGNEDILEKLGSSEQLDADSEMELKEKLKQYVSAGAKYTPIVNYVELSLPKECLYDLEIVDTPGLNDPIISRGERTKDFLRNCDVALLLSRCSQFMPDSTVKLMAQQMPRSGVQDILVIGSQLDNGLANYKGKNYTLEQAYRQARAKYIGSFNSNMQRAKSMYPELAAKLEGFQKHEPIFVSAMCDSAVQKIREKRPLSEAEKTMKDNLSYFEGFEWNESLLVFLSGMEKVRKALNEVRARKAETIAGKNTTFLDQAKYELLSTIEQIQQSVIRRRKMLKEIEEDNPTRLSAKYDDLKDVLDSSREQLTAHFKIAGNNAEGSANEIYSQFLLEQNNFTDFKVTVKSHIETRSYDEGWWIFSTTKYRDYEVTTCSASRADVSSNIEGYYGKCRTIVNKHFSSLFSKDRLRQNVKEIILDAFKVGGKEYDEKVILSRLDLLFSEIVNPNLEDYPPCENYLDKLETRCPDKTVKNDAIDELADAQIRILGEIASDFQANVKKDIESLKKSMNDLSTSFADELVTYLESEQKALLKQLENKEKTLKEYDLFEKALRDKKRGIDNLFQTANA